MEIPILTLEQVGNLEWESATLEMSFADNHPNEINAILKAQRDDTIRRVAGMENGRSFRKDDPDMVWIRFTYKDWEALEKIAEETSRR